MKDRLDFMRKVYKKCPYKDISCRCWRVNFCMYYFMMKKQLLKEQKNG